MWPRPLTLERCIVRHFRTEFYCDDDDEDDVDHDDDDDGDHDVNNDGEAQKCLPHRYSKQRRLSWLQ